MKEKKIELNDENQFMIKVDEIDNIEKSYFIDIYIKAFRNIKEIILNTEGYYEKYRRVPKDIFAYKGKSEKNNIIAFIGERGTGKTSAMVSFAKALCDIQEDNKKEKIRNLLVTEVGSESEKILNANYWVLDLIDPSLFENNESIFSMILARLFQVFKGVVNNSRNDYCTDQKQREIVKLFKEVNDNINQLSTKLEGKKSVDLSESLEELSSRAASSNLRMNFIDLVNRLLKYKFNEQEEKNYLVIPIDDVDMSIQNVYKVVEDIRRYLQIPNIIILMAAKIEQLSDSIEQAFINANMTMFERGKGLNEDTKTMAARYIEKLIPNGRKLYLPTLEYSETIHHTIIQFSNTNGGELEEKLNVQRTVLRLIFKKTGLVFLEPQYGINMLVPNNLRELQNFVAVLRKLKDVKVMCLEEECDITYLEYNLNTFEEYIKNTWMQRNLSNESIHILSEMVKLPKEMRNEYIINELKIKHDKEEVDAKIGRQRDICNFSFSDILHLTYPNNGGNKAKAYYNYSLGDVLAELERHYTNESEEVRKFKFAIEMIYSIEIFKDIYLYNAQEEAYKVVAGGVLRDMSECLMRAGRAKFIVNSYNKLPILFDVKGKNKENDKEEVYRLRIRLDNAIKMLVRGKLNGEEEIECKYNEQYIGLGALGLKIDIDKQVIYNKCLEQVLFISYFFTPIKSDANNKQYYEETEYDVMASLGTGNHDTEKAEFWIFNFIHRLLNTDKVTESIFYNKYRSDGKENDFKNIINSCRETQLSVQNISWKANYKTVIPLYSVEYLLAIRKELESNKRYIDIKKKMENSPYKYCLEFTKKFEEVLRKVNKDLLTWSNDDVHKGLGLTEYIIDAYSKCQFVTNFSNNISQCLQEQIEEIYHSDGVNQDEEQDIITIDPEIEELLVGIRKIRTNSSVLKARLLMGRLYKVVTNKINVCAPLPTLSGERVGEERKTILKWADDVENMYRSSTR